jgi:rod shape-determining protein MreD
MNRLVMIASLLLCAMVQAISPDWAALGQAKPPLLLGVVMYYALSRENTQVIECALIAGLLQDSLGPIPHGFSVIAFLSIALLINHYRERVFSDHWFTHAVMGIAASVWVCFVLYILLVGSGLRTGVPFSFAMSKALGMSLLGIVAMPILYRLIEKLDRNLGNLHPHTGGLGR